MAESKITTRLHPLLASLESATSEAVVEVLSSLRSRQGSDEADPQSDFIGGESELSTTELLLPEETTRPFLSEPPAILPESPSIYAQ
jgi:hypothetical protein